MLNRIKNALYRFMYGRYGSDELSRFLLIVSFAVALISILFGNGILRLVFYGLFWAIVIYTYFRMFSKNIYKRRAENDFYLGKKKYIIQRFKQRKEYKFYDCPKCKTHLRVPRGVGKVTITCKKCGHQFDRKA